MKKLLLIAAALTTMVSCSKTQVIPEETQQQEIAMKAFNQTAVKATTGPIAPGDGKLAVTDESMTVFAYYEESTVYFGQNGAVFSYDDAKVWKSTTKYYWPSAGSMKFFAVFPTDYPNESGSISSSYNETTGITTSITKVNLATLANQKDIMYSYLDVPSCPPAQAPTLTFEHLLSQVVVNVTISDNTLISLTSLSIKDAYVEGDIDVVENNSELSYSYDVESKADFVVSSGTAVLVLPNYTPSAVTNVTIDKDGVNPIAAPKLSISYTLNSVPITKDIDLGTVWEKGKKYVYNVTISLNEIIFTAEVSSWEDGDIANDLDLSL